MKLKYAKQDTLKTEAFNERTPSTTRQHRATDKELWKTPNKNRTGHMGKQSCENTEFNTFTRVNTSFKTYFAPWHNRIQTNQCFTSKRCKNTLEMCP
jgi:hypothetical protein